MSGIMEQVPPHNPDIELAIISSVLNRYQVMSEIEPIVSPSDFYETNNAIIFKRMSQMYSKGSSIDMVSLAEELERNNELERIGGKYKLLEITERNLYFDEKSTIGWAKQLRELSKYRELISVGYSMVIDGYNATGDNASPVIAEAMSKITALALANNTETIPIGTALDNLMRGITGGTRNYITPPGIPFSRAKAGDLIVVAAGTSVGKTALSLCWADEWSKDKQVTYFEYEMEEADLMARLVCKYSGVSLDKIQDGSFTSEEYQRIEDSTKVLKTRNLRVEEVWCDITTLMAKIRNEARQGAEIVFIDHIGLIPFHAPANMSIAKAIGKCITNPLKNLASELGIIIVILVQLNRAGQGEDFPKLYHLRDSGEIEQDASIVYMLWSEKTIMYDKGKRISMREGTGVLNEEECQFPGDELMIHVGVEKNMNGRLGESWLIYHGDTFTYEDRNDSDQKIWINRELPVTEVGGGVTYA